MDPELAAAIGALRAGLPVVLPTDTVYGLCALPDEMSVGRLYALKGRAAGRPTALLAASVDALVTAVPELDGRPARIARALLPGPYTLVVPNPASRYPWLAGSRADAIGVRVAELPEPAARVLAAVGAVAATSANLPGGADPATLDEVPDAIRSGCGAAVDAGRVGGTASTVVDLTGAEPVVLREGAVPAAEALERIRAVLPR